jgi:polyketide cyclase/dehydrase/lipid transport protein
MLLNILIAVVVLVVAAIVGLLIAAASKPDTFRIERSGEMQAPPDKIFTQINDFHNWASWSPWEKMDPNLKRTYSGAASGWGAIYEWEGNKKVGKGRMEIAESLAPSKITINLDFLKPFEAHNTAEFTLEPKGDTTKLTWAMLGRQPFMFKVMKIFLDMDKMVGKDFEAGLANLKAIAEA